MTLRNLVVGLDGNAPSDAALRWAATLPEKPHITAVTAIAPASELVADALQLDSHAMTDHLRSELTGPWTAGVRDTGADLATEVRHDDAARALLDVADDVDADAIVVGTHSRHRWSLHTVGSVITKLSHRSDRPVIVVPPEGADAAGDIVVGSDGSDGADAALMWAASHAADTGQRIHLVRVLDLSIHGTLLAFGRVDMDLVRSGVTAQLDDAARDLGGGSVNRAEVVDGPAVETLIAAASGKSMLVLGRSRTKTDVVTGSVARACVARSSVPVVLVARP